MVMMTNYISQDIERMFQACNCIPGMHIKDLIVLLKLLYNCRLLGKAFQLSVGTSISPNPQQVMLHL